VDDDVELLMHVYSHEVRSV